MNTDARPPAGNRPEGPDLPALSEERIARIEEAVFERIAGERRAARPASPSKARARRRGWLTAAGVAAAFAVGVVVTPAALNGLGAAAGGADAASESPNAGWHLVTGDDSRESADMGGGAAGSVAEAPAAATREVIVNGSATLRVDELRTAADAITALAAEHGGRVESLRIGSDDAAPTDSAVRPRGSGWVTVRVPAADLVEVMTVLDGIGTVLSTSVDETDVTGSAVDLRARISAAEASVQRLTELMAQAGSVADLLEAESTLTDRQAELEGYRQQLDDLEDQVAMSSLSVSLTETPPAASADPTGFGEGVAAGWAGFLAALNGLVIVLGFLVPWLAAAAVVGAIVWAVVRVRRARLGARTRDEARPNT
ncbi:hypothetical protein GCM10025768_25750 [Microbacterium pseudoresistens]|uniref:DUF4349 domain-containing protein n=1 Tax=Microbacterium pseudoresistens TaxID=640634 RepID=A0A7Y9EWG0_9MICO|nr:DUF4349 domain-containing protein [Microbacterium pseudoresistens]NYD55215.1 hypothetical protein [Microbacterium pseudoresistens]